MKFSRALASALVALALVLISAQSFAAAESEASVGYCEGCDNGVVILTMNGGEAVVLNLQLDADSGHYFGSGRVSYHAQGVDIEDNNAQFEVEVVDSPTAASSSCPHATKLASSVRVIGSTVKFVLSTSNFEAVVDGARCAEGKMDVLIDDSPKSFGKIKKLYRSEVTTGGKVLKV